MTKLLQSLGLALMLAFTLTGCQLYFGGDDPDTRTPGGDGGGWSCADNADCAAGCYCSDAGYCEEAGFCSVDTDCAPGYICDDRSSCVPDPGPTCTADADCAAGSYCAADGTCVTSCICETDAEAQSQGWHHCDETRGTCEPTDEAGTCSGAPTCGVEPPCAVGSVPLVGADGCWTGACSATASCDVTPTCNLYQHEADCFGAAGCSASYTGLNCRKPDGTMCQAGDSGCVCESFVFAECL